MEGAVPRITNKLWARSELKIWAIHKNENQITCGELAKIYDTLINVITIKKTKVV